MRCEKGEIQFKFHNTGKKNLDGKLQRKTVFNDNTINFYHSCTGDTPETATQFIYDEEHEDILCPSCKHFGSELGSEMVQTLKEYIEKHTKPKVERPLMMVEVNYDWETGLHYYALNKRIDYDDWKKVKDYFQYYNKWDWEDCEPMGQTVGWMTTVPIKVEKALGITETLEKQAEKRKQVDKKKVEEQKKREAQRKLIDNAFKDAKYMKPNDLRELRKNYGDVYEDPKQSWYHNQMYGGGHLWIISKEDNFIYDIHNNGRDGDDWSRNNIRTGGAGAVGYEISYDETVANAIKEYVKR